MSVVDRDASPTKDLRFEDWSWGGTRLTEDSLCSRSLRGFESGGTHDLARKTVSYYLAHYFIHEVLTSYAADIALAVRGIGHATGIRVGPASAPKRAEGGQPEIEKSSLQDRLGLIQSALGLRTSDLAKSLQVSRQTIYAWIRGDVEPQLRHRRRLETLLLIARNALPLGAIRPGRIGTSVGRRKSQLLNALLADTLDEAEITGLVRSAWAEGRRERIPSITKKARQLGIDTSRVASQDELFDRESGRRATGDES